MSKQFDEAPPLPRQPTALSVPAAMQAGATAAAAADAADDAVAALPVDAHALPPPPKFPSLTDVALPHAEAAAQAMPPPDALPQIPRPPTDTPPAPAPAPLPSATELPPPERARESELPPPSAEPLPAPSSPPPRPVSEAASQDIAAAIAHSAVAPGTGDKAAAEAGDHLWTPTDQRELDRLLQEGKAVYVPPDVSRDDMPVLRHASYVPVPVRGDQVVPGVDAQPDDRTVKDRVAAWNQVVPEEEEGDAAAQRGPIVPVPLVVPGPGVEEASGAPIDGDTTGAAAAAAAPQDAASRAVDAQGVAEGEGEEVAQQVGARGADAAPGATGGVEEAGEAGDSSAMPAEGATTPSGTPDFTRTIFGGNFTTVPVTSRREAAAALEPVAEEDADTVETTEVKLKSENRANIDITHDYGLKGGHASGVNDAAFLNDDTLVTCGNDGKVCIWDMKDRTVDSDFVPYAGEAVVMVYPMPQEDTAQAITIMTLSKSRLMRIWSVNDRQAVMLRTTQIKPSENDLYMSVPVISQELKSRAAAALAAATVTTTDAPHVPTHVEANAAEEEEEGQAADATGAEAVGAEAAPAVAAEAVVDAEEEEEKDKKRFSFTKVLSFGRSNSSRKTPAAAT